MASAAGIPPSCWPASRELPGATSPCSAREPTAWTATVPQLERSPMAKPLRARRQWAWIHRPASDKATLTLFSTALMTPSSLGPAETICATCAFFLPSLDHSTPKAHLVRKIASKTCSTHVTNSAVPCNPNIYSGCVSFALNARHATPSAIWPRPVGNQHGRSRSGVSDPRQAQRESTHHGRRLAPPFCHRTLHPPEEARIRYASPLYRRRFQDVCALCRAYGACRVAATNAGSLEADGPHRFSPARPGLSFGAGGH